MSDITDEDRAYHEAGHAVVMRSYRIQFGGILMSGKPDEGYEARTFGSELCDWVRGASGDQEERIHAALEVLAAGEAAQLQRMKNEVTARWGAFGDWKAARRILASTTDDSGTPLAPDVQISWWNSAKERVRLRFSGQGSEWRAVERLASELLCRGDMDFVQICKIVDPLLMPQPEVDS